VPGVLVTDAGRDQLLLVDDLAAPSPQWFGSSGSADKEWHLPWGIANAPGGYVVSDSGNHRIAMVSDPDASNWSALGSHGSGDLEFDRPAGVAVDTQGRIYVADLGNARIVRVDDIDGTGWTTYGTPGAPSAVDPQAVGRFHEPVAVAVDENDAIWIADQKALRLVRVDDMTGAGWLAIGGGVPVGLGLGGADDVLVCDLGARAIIRRDVTTTDVFAQSDPLAGPGAALAAPGGDTLALDNVSSRVFALDDQLAPDGAPLFLADLGARRPMGMCLR
jgi:streptogramin lyase